MNRLYALLGALFLAGPAFALNPPSNLSVLSPASGGHTVLSWTYSPTVTSWGIYYNNNLVYTVGQTDVGVTGTAATFTVGGITDDMIPLPIKMTAFQIGAGTSGYSASVTVTGSTLPVAWVSVAQAVTPVDITLSATPSWTYVYLTVNAATSDITIWNTSGYTINWILEPTTSVPKISGAPLASPGVLNIPVPKGMNYFQFTASASATGYLQLHF